MNYFIICCDDTRYNNETISAYSIASRRLHGYYWPLYKYARGINMLSRNDKFVLYIAGHKEYCKNFISCGEIESIDNVEKFYEFDFSSRLTEVMVTLDKIIFFENHVSILDLISKLDILKRHNNKLGLALAGGIKKISRDDYDLIIRSAGPQKPGTPV